MSTKTNFKRVALVAVAALGLGVLTSVAPASATIVNGDVTIDNVAGDGSIAAVGVCVVDTSGDAINSGTTVAKGAVLKFITATGNGTLTITGPATWSDVTGATLDAAASKATFVAGDTATLKTSAVGTVKVVAKNTNGATVTSFGINVVESCSSASTPVPANTLLGINTQLATTDGTDATMAYADIAYEATVYVNIQLRNAYKGPVSAGVLTATATNGALISFNDSSGAGSGISSTAFAQTTAGAGVIALSVKQDTTTNPGKALTSAITFAFNGVTVGTKTVTIRGEAASITVSKVVGGISGNNGTFEYIVQDNAGNSVQLTQANPAGVLNWTNAGFTSGDVISAAEADSDYTADANKSSFTTKGTGIFSCKSPSTKSSGSVDIAVGAFDGSLTAIKSNTFKAACGQGADTFTVALDKAVYSTGEIATLTITAKDKLGFAVGDGTQVGAGIAADLGGLEIIGSAATSTDEFSGGVKTYKFRVLQNVGSFVGQAKITATTDTSVKTLQYKIVASDSGTSMEDVLKAIVSLIASINKQIAALQKALLKKK